MYLQYIPILLSVNYYIGTRKIVNYTWIGRSQRKLWWRIS